MSDIVNEYRAKKVIQLCKEAQKLCAESSFAAPTGLGADIVTPKLRKVRRRRCNECCHLESEHVKKAVCWDVKNSHWETVMLPICIYCGATCGDIEDEMCAKCFKAPNDPHERTGATTKTL